MHYHFISLGNAFALDEKAWLDVYFKRLSGFVKTTHQHHKDKLEKYASIEDPGYEKWIRSLIQPHTALMVLDQHGKKHSTETLCTKLNQIALEKKHITFLIGGSYGLPSTIKKSASHTISLSTMTLPHKIALLVCAEQVYRCMTIEKNIPYHHG